MVQGVKLTDSEKRYIEDNESSKFPSQIAKELSANFKMDNGGHRHPETVKDYLKELTV